MRTAAAQEGLGKGPAAILNGRASLETARFDNNRDNNPRRPPPDSDGHSRTERTRNAWRGKWFRLSADRDERLIGVLKNRWGQPRVGSSPTAGSTATVPVTDRSN
jgi:hypothetical protein